MNFWSTFIYISMNILKTHICKRKNVRSSSLYRIRNRDLNPRTVIQAVDIPSDVLSIMPQCLPSSLLKAKYINTNTTITSNFFQACHVTFYFNFMHLPLALRLCPFRSGSTKQQFFFFKYFFTWKSYRGRRRERQRSSNFWFHPQ